MQKLIASTLYLAAITIPLIFTTINYELFEFPKFILLLAFTIIIAVAWTIDVYPKRKELPGDILQGLKSLTPVSIGVLLILATQLLATIFSIDSSTSFWGYYSRFHQGLLTTICYTLIYFASLRYLDYKSTQKLIKIAVSTAILVSLYAIAQRLGIDKNLWVQDVVNRPFSTLGQPNWLAAYLLPNLFLTLYTHQTNTNKSQRLYHLLAYTAIFSAILLTKSRSGIIAFVLGFIAYWALTFRALSWPKIKKPLVIFSTISLIIGIVIKAPFSTPPEPVAPSGTQLESGGTESGDIRKIVWTGALNLVKKRPFLGTGPETFAYSYYWTRPVEHNLTSEWDFLYNKAHNEYLNIAATSGLIGITAYLFWHFAVAKLALTRVISSKKSNKKKEIALATYFPVLGASLISFSVTNFFGFSVIPVYLGMILLSALPQAIDNTPTKNKTSPSYSVLTLISLLLILLFPIRLFIADLAFNKGKVNLAASNLVVAERELKKAINLRPSEPLFHSSLAEAYALLASSSSSINYQDLAIEEIEFTKKNNPWHLNYSKSRTKAWLSLTTLDPSFHAQAAKELEEARALAPSDPKLAYNLGLIYSRIDMVDQSIRQMIDSITLKPDYYQPYYALTLLYETTKQTKLVLPLLEQASNNISPLPEPLQTKLDLYSTN